MLYVDKLLCIIGLSSVILTIWESITPRLIPIFLLLVNECYLEPVTQHPSY